ncbi:MAG TPA: endonuclease domain-containing protein [Bosea sp. (in: a-proteobacteria)]|jgi:very-short-patch-repair endonuclease|nr:endonuclease domain-containing protein [Bosea sp. (in: a-proteobacteria)]
MPHAKVRPAQRRRAKQLRKEMTGPEKKLWHELKAHRAGTHFRKQVPIGPYIADFACHSAKLIIEIDGDQHSLGRRQVSDLRRDAWFAEQGYRTLRFSNWQVMNEFESVVLTIAAAAQSLLETAEPCIPPSQPSPTRGEGSRALSDKSASDGEESKP